MCLLFFFSRVKEAEEDIAQNERLYDLSSSTTDRAIFSEVKAPLQHALLCEEFFFFSLTVCCLLGSRRRY